VKGGWGVASPVVPGGGAPVPLACKARGSAGPSARRAKFKMILKLANKSGLGAIYTCRNDAA
jgi:hypothetical protein